MAKRKDNRFACAKTNTEVCVIGLTGNAECENCELNNKCDVCARQNTESCNKCFIRDELSETK